MTEKEKTTEFITDGDMVDLDKFQSRGQVVPHETMPVVLDRSSMIELAIRQGSDLIQLEKLMELQEKHEAREARKDFNIAMAEFKANIPPVVKDKLNKQFDSMYASEHALLNTINPILSQYYLSASFTFPKSEKPDIFFVTCTIAHRSGHSESVTIPGPLDTSGAKNPLQAVRSTVTYLKKVAFEAITGIATSDPDADDNGNLAGTGYITDEQVKLLEFLAEETNSDVLKWQKVDSLSQILAKDYAKIEAGLREKKKKQKQPGDES